MAWRCGSLPEREWYPAGRDALRGGGCRDRVSSGMREEAGDERRAATEQCGAPGRESDLPVATERAGGPTGRAGGFPGLRGMGIAVEKLIDPVRLFGRTGFIIVVRLGALVGFVGLDRPVGLIRRVRVVRFDRSRFGRARL